ncbi:GNAT family N-acetyltransferase [Trueperella sp. LYQ141]|uniref:GNAT family N-acetyltransferase n=1 Tax=Trueperella sp. LYQ141 TaxID=3391058 RepID=UPI00398357A9
MTKEEKAVRYRIEPLDVTDTERALACREIDIACQQEVQPDYVAGSPDSFLRHLRDNSGNWVPHYVVAVTDDEQRKVLGWGMLSYCVPHPQDPMYVTISVAKDVRGQGIGSALEAAVRSCCPADWPAQQYFMESYMPADVDVTTHPITRWAQKAGWKLTEIDQTLRLAWPPALADVDAVMPAVPDGYELRTYENGVPLELQESLGVLRGQMDAEAPSGEIEFSAEPWSSEYYAEFVSDIVGCGATLLETVAVHEGRVVGFTGVEVPADSRRVMRVRGTGVLRSHRGKRLGLAVKAQLVRELLLRGVKNPAIETETAVNNPWMLAINNALGFTPVCQLVEYVRGR